MKNRFSFVCFSAVLLFVLACVASAQEHEKAKKMGEGFRPDAFEKADREEWQKPDEVVAKLNLKPGDVAADVGAGSGYFTRRFARAVEPNGVAYAVDIDEKMLRFIHERAEQDNQRNIVTVLCPTNDPMLAPNSTDVIFFCNTIHHISNRADYYKRIQRCLKPGGRLVNVDFHKRELPVGPPIQEKIAKEDMIKEATDSGFKLAEDIDLLPHQYFLVFTFEKSK